jgi:hypothetical protein
MNTNYFASPGGRLINGTIGFALLAAGALATAGPGPHEIFFLAAVPLVCIVAALFAVGLSISEHGGYAFALLLALPICAGPYLGLLIVAPNAGLAVAVALLVPGVLLGSAAALGPRLQIEPQTHSAGTSTVR